MIPCFVQIFLSLTDIVVHIDLKLKINFFAFVSRQRILFFAPYCDFCECEIFSDTFFNG